MLLQKRAARRWTGRDSATRGASRARFARHAGSPRNWVVKLGQEVGYQIRFENVNVGENEKFVLSPRGVFTAAND